MKPLYMLILLSAVLIFISGCAGGGFKKIDPDLNLDLDTPQVNEEDSVIDELTPIIIIGDDVSVAVYKCSTDTDCNRCKDGDVYTQDCVINNGETGGTCQGSLDLAQECKDECSAGGAYSTGEDLDLDFINEAAIVDNDDLLPDTTQCSSGIEKCPSYQRGIGSVYLTEFPECKCSYIYVPPGCNPMEPPCSDFSSKTAYPDCACTK